MKKYIEIMEEIKNIPQPEDNFKRRERLNAELKAAGKDKEKLFAISNRDHEQTKAEEMNTARRKVLYHNAKIALTSEYFPIIIEILNKYAGKRIGEKTEQKIEDEVHERTKGALSIGFKNQYGSGRIEMYPKIWGLSHFTIYADNQFKIYNEDGKLNALTLNMFSYNRESEYIEDIDGYIMRKIKELDALNNAVREIQKMYDNYNSDLAEGFERADSYHMTYYNRLF